MQVRTRKVRGNTHVMIRFDSKSWIKIIHKNGAGKLTSSIHKKSPPMPKQLVDKKTPGRLITPDGEAWLDEVAAIHKWNCFCDGIEALVLAQVLAGLDITNLSYMNSLQAAYDAGVNNVRD